MSGKNFLEKLLDGGEFQTKTLGELGNFIRGSGIQKSDFTESGAGCIHYGQIHTHYGTWATETKSFISHDLAARLRKAHTGDLVIATTSEDDDAVAKAVAWLGEEAAAVSTDAYIYRHSANPKYMSYFFQTEFFQSQKKPYITGTKVRRISGDSLAKIQIPIPCPDSPKKSLVIQAEIVRILDNFTELTAELTAELIARKTQYNYYRDKLLSFEEGEVEWKTLGDVASLRRGRVMSKGYLAENAGPFPVFSSQTVNNGVIGQINTFDFDGEFISWTTDGANAGTVFHRAGKFSITNVCGLIKINDESRLNYKFLYYWLSIEAKKHVYAGMGNPKLMSHQVEKIPVPIPYPESPTKSLEEQKRIVAILDKFATLTFSITEGLPREIELRQKQYAYYRNLLLSFPKPEGAEA